MTVPRATRTRYDFPWATIIAFGLSVLKLPPAHFWALTPRELSLMLGQTTASFSNKNLHALMQRYPDT